MVCPQGDKNGKSFRVDTIRIWENSDQYKGTNQQ